VGASGRETGGEVRESGRKWGEVEITIVGVKYKLLRVNWNYT